MKSPRFAGFIEMRLVRWIDRWRELGVGSLADERRRGRPPLLTLEEQEKAFALAMKNPKFPHRQLSAIKRETGKEISRSMLKNLIKKRIIFGKGSS
jgi:transposase